ncbi:MAG: hypothetical protein U0792_07410 [Gemmataceae bacterium]
MNLRIAILGMAVVCGLSAWLWCRPCASEVKAHSAGSSLTADSSGGNEDEAVARYRSNGCRHWRQIALKR